MVKKRSELQSSELLNRQAQIMKAVNEIEKSSGIVHDDTNFLLSNIEELGEYIESMYCEDDPECLNELDMEVDDKISTELEFRLAYLAAEVKNIKRVG